MALEAIEADVDEGGGMSQLRGFKLALTDIRVYLLAGIYKAITAASGFQSFFPTLTASLGYDRFISLLLVAPPFAFITIWSCLHSLASDRYQQRFWFVFYPIPISIIGFVLFMTTDSFGPKYFAAFLMMFCLNINGTLYSWLASSIPRPPAKRAVAYAFVNAIGNSSSIWTPFSYLDKDKPHFRTAMSICAGMMVVAGILAVIFREILRRENKKFEEEEASRAAQDNFEGPGFRYVL